jgi:Zn ribbon nucleic-acid-binding protein
MNLERLALARAEEQLAHVDLREPEPRRPKIRVVKFKGGGRPIGCFCGECTRCQKREWMRRWRAGNIPVPVTCSRCGNRKLKWRNTTGWCKRCQQKHPGEFKRHLAARFAHGGGI